MQPHLSERLVHVLTRADLATLLTPTYAAAANVDDEEAHDRLTRALSDPELLEGLYSSISEALRKKLSARMEVDALMDKLAKRVALRKGHIKEAPASPQTSAAVVRINLVLGLAPESMRAVLETAKGKEALQGGLRALGAHLVAELLK